MTAWISFVAFFADRVVRLAAVLLTRCCYRIRSRGGENVPQRGAALLVSNHVSYADAVLIASCLARRVRFVMVRRIYENRWLNWLFRLMKVIPISMDESPKRILASLRAAREALDEGSLVCLFPEGRISTTGLPADFKSGFEYILRGSAHPIVPVYLGGVYGSIFSYYRTAPFRRLPIRVPYPVTVLFGRPMASTASAGEAREAVVSLSRQFIDEERAKGRPLPAHIREVDVFAEPPFEDGARIPAAETDDRAAKGAGN